MDTQDPRTQEILQSVLGSDPDRDQSAAAREYGLTWSLHGGPAGEAGWAPRFRDEESARDAYAGHLESEAWEQGGLADYVDQIRETDPEGYEMHGLVAAYDPETRHYNPDWDPAPRRSRSRRERPEATAAPPASTVVPSAAPIPFVATTTPAAPPAAVTFGGPATAAPPGRGTDLRGTGVDALNRAALAADLASEADPRALWDAPIGVSLAPDTLQHDPMVDLPRPCYTDSAGTLFCQGDAGYDPSLREIIEKEIDKLL